MKKTKKEVETLFDETIDNLIKNKKVIVKMLSQYKEPEISYFDKKTTSDVIVMFRMLDETNCEFIFEKGDE